MTLIKAFARPALGSSPTAYAYRLAEAAAGYGYLEAVARGATTAERHLLRLADGLTLREIGPPPVSQYTPVRSGLLRRPDRNRPVS